MLNSFNQEYISYHHPEWHHSILYTVFSKNSLKYIPLHWHPEIQFIVVMTGFLKVYMGSNSKILAKGEGMFINSGVIHEIHAENDSSSFICWNIGADAIDSYLEKQFVTPLIADDTLPFLLLKNTNKNQKIIINSVQEAYRIFESRSRSFELTVTGLYLDCLKHLLEEVSLDQHTKDLIYDPRVKKLLSFIHDNYNHNITLKSLSEIVYLSESETIRLFKKHIGKTPIKYLLNYRLLYSLYFLTDTQSSISEIAHQCGFSSVSYYIKSFKSNYQMTPNQYRKNH